MGELVLVEATHFGKTCPSSLTRSSQLMKGKAWWIDIKVSFNKKRNEPKVTFVVYSIPPERKERFKTTSYKELCEWLKAHKLKLEI